MIRRKNFSTKSWTPKKYKTRVTGNPEDMYREWHWGVNPNPEPVEVEDDDYPDVLIECGRLVEFTYRPVNAQIKRKDKSYKLEDKGNLYKLDKKDSNSTHLVFDPYHPNDRLYIVTTSKKAKEKVKKDLYKSNPYQDTPLSDISLYVGGRHAATDYPDVEARVIGVLTSIVYACEKKGDGYSFYVHQMGEESGIQPTLCVDKTGRLWIVGGNYTAPIQGITD